MLKIKDEVDLKELEKFGFKLNEKEWYEINCSNGYMYIYPISRKIIFEPINTVSTVKTDILYDLIQAGLVEKVSDIYNVRSR